MPGAPSSFLLLLVRHLLLVAMHLFLVASLLLVAMPGAPSSFLLLLVRHLLLVAMHLFLVASLLLVAMPGAPSSFLLLLVRNLLLVAMHLFLVASLLLVAMPGAPSGVLVPLCCTTNSVLFTSTVLPPGGHGGPPDETLEGLWFHPLCPRPTRERGCAGRSMAVGWGGGLRRAWADGFIMIYICGLP